MHLSFGRLRICGHFWWMHEYGVRQCEEEYEESGVVA